MGYAGFGVSIVIDFLNYKSMFEFNSIQVIESATCLQTWQLTDFTKELMGAEWASKFNEWAEIKLPKQPACYMLGKQKMIVHPSIAQAIRDEVKKQAQSQIDWFTSYSLRSVDPLGFIVANCSA